MTPFGVRLRTALDTRGPLCVGIDPHDALLAAWDLPDDPSGLERFAMTVVEAVADRAAVLKPQSAFFERHGSAGVAVLERTMVAARDAGALVLLDAKRGDIGSTVAAYAQAYCDPASPLYADAVTVTPVPRLRLARPAARAGRGARRRGVRAGPDLEPGGPGGAARPARRRPHGRRQRARPRPRPRTPPPGRRASSARSGVVVGATLGSTGEDLDVGGPLLAPGLGAQGATPAGLAALFGPALPAVLPAMSREVLRAGPHRRGPAAARSTLLSVTAGAALGDTHALSPGRAPSVVAGPPVPARFTRGPTPRGARSVRPVRDRRTRRSPAPIPRGDLRRGPAAPHSRTARRRPRQGRRGPQGPRRAQGQAQVRRDCRWPRSSRPRPSDEIVGKMKVSAVLESMPGVGKVRAQKLMEKLRDLPDPPGARPRRQAAGGARGRVRRGRGLTPTGGRLTVLSGPSGVGKGTVVAEIRAPPPPGVALGLGDDPGAAPGGDRRAWSTTSSTTPSSPGWSPPASCSSTPGTPAPATAPRGRRCCARLAAGVPALLEIDLQGARQVRGCHARGAPGVPRPALGGRARAPAHRPGHREPGAARRPARAGRRRSSPRSRSSTPWWSTTTSGRPRTGW